MPSTYAGNGALFSATVPVLAKKDRVDNAVYAPAFQTLADQCEYLRTRMPVAMSVSLDETIAWAPGVPGAICWHTNGGAGPLGPGDNGAFIDFAGCGVGDKIVIRSAFSTTKYNTNGTNAVGSGGNFHLYAIDDVGGTPHANNVPGTNYLGDSPDFGNMPPGGVDRIGGSSIPLPGFMVKFTGMWTIANAGTCRIQLVGTNLATTLFATFTLSAVRFPAP